MTIRIGYPGFHPSDRPAALGRIRTTAPIGNNRCRTACCSIPSMLCNRKGALVGVLCAGLGACSLAPPYQRPSLPTPTAFSGAGDWKLAQPATAAREKGPWWQVYHDSELDGLELRVDSANQSLKAGFARLQEARAQTRIARSAYFPTISGTAAADHYRNSLYAPTHSAATPTVANDLPLNGDL